MVGLVAEVALICSQHRRSRVSSSLMYTHPSSSCESEEGAASSRGVLEEGLECPVCWESFDDGNNAPYVLWCGHSLCRNCVVSLQWAVIKVPGLAALQLPLFIACPWCQFLTVRFTWKGKLRYPCKNFFLLWIVESARSNAARTRYSSEECETLPVPRPSSSLISPRSVPRSGPHRIPAYAVEQQQHHGAITEQNGVIPHNWLEWAQRRRLISRIMAMFVQFTAKLPLVLLFLFMVVYVIPFSTLVLAVYCLLTLLFAVPSFLVVYFSYPSLDWLVHEIVT
ncbi:unnamed protein product [Sphagnum balticum]